MERQVRSPLSPPPHPPPPPPHSTHWQQIVTVCSFEVLLFLGSASLETCPHATFPVPHFPCPMSRSLCPCAPCSVPRAHVYFGPCDVVSHPTPHPLPHLVLPSVPWQVLCENAFDNSTFNSSDMTLIIWQPCKPLLMLKHPFLAGFELLTYTQLPRFDRLRKWPRFYQGLEPKPPLAWILFTKW